MVDDRSTIEQIAGDTVREYGAELFSVNVHAQHGTNHVRLVVDTDNGIGMDVCARINKAVCRRLEEQQYEDYTVEVSSPGLDRALKHPDDFRRVLGKSVRVYLRQAAEGRTEYSGTLESAGSDMITLVTTDGERHIVPVSAIAKAKLEIRW